VVASLSTTAIETENLTKIFRKGKKNETIAIQDINLKIAAGQVFGLLGPNGAGKTTLIRVLTGLLKPTSGSAKVLGYDILYEIEKIRPRIALLPQESGVYEYLTARENLIYFGGLYGIPTDVLEERADKLLKQVGLEDRADDITKSFSGGMKRKVLVARALITDPDIIFLDEPTTGIDTIGAKTIRELLKELSANHNRTIILTTHDLHEVSELCREVAILNKGRIVGIGTPDDLEEQFKAKNLEEVFVSLVRGE